jgi:hypothetical protein
MDKKFILSTKRFANSPEIDYNLNIELKSDYKSISNEEDVTNIDLSELFNIEREKTFKYRLIGKIDYLSIINNLVNNYSKLSDLFIRYHSGTTNKNIFNSFKIYLLKKSDTYISLGNNLYKERYDIIADLSDIQLYNCGFSKNIFFEQNYLFNYNIDIDLEDQKDYFNKPTTELFLYFDYQLNIMKSETLLKKDFNQFSNETNNLTITQINNIDYDIDTDLIIGNLIKREDNQFDEEIINQQIHRIRLEIGSDIIFFKFNPFIKIKIREYNDTVYFGNVNTNTKNIIKIPEYAKFVGNPNEGNVIWKEILPHGFIDPISNLGVNFPFVNGRHYIYTNNVFAIQPDLSDFNTNTIFEKMLIQGYKTDLFILNNPNQEIC